MSRLEELIAELCPEGVEYKTLGEIAGVSRGGSFQKKGFSFFGRPMYSLWADIYEVRSICG